MTRAVMPVGISRFFSVMLSTQTLINQSISESDIIGYGAVISGAQFIDTAFILA